MQSLADGACQMWIGEGNEQCAVGLLFHVDDSFQGMLGFLPLLHIADEVVDLFTVFGEKVATDRQ